MSQMRMLQVGYERNTSPRTCIDRDIGLFEFVPKNGSYWKPAEFDCIEVEIDGKSPDKRERCRYVIQLPVEELLLMFLSLNTESAERAARDGFIALRELNKLRDRPGPEHGAVLGALRGLLSLIPPDLE